MGLPRGSKISVIFSLALVCIIIAVVVPLSTKRKASVAFTSGTYRPTTERFQNMYAEILETIENDTEQEEQPSTTVTSPTHNANENLVDDNNSNSNNNNNDVAGDQNMESTHSNSDGNQDTDVTTTTSTTLGDTNPNNNEKFTTETAIDPDEFVENIEKEVTPQAKALNWIANYDDAKLPADHPNLQIRYSLATFFYATSNEGQFWHNKKNWMSGKGYCDWFGVVCDPARRGSDGNGVVIGLNLTENGLRGPMVPEMGFFTDLSEFYFSI